MSSNLLPHPWHCMYVWKVAITQKTLCKNKNVSRALFWTIFFSFLVMRQNNSAEKITVKLNGGKGTSVTGCAHEMKNGAGAKKIERVEN